MADSTNDLERLLDVREVSKPLHTLFYRRTWRKTTKTITPGSVLEEIEEMTESMARPERANKFLFVIISSALGFLMISALLLLSVYVPEPTPSQLRIWISVLAIASAAFSVSITGALDVQLTMGKGVVIAATGAFAVLVIFFFFNPAVLSK